MGICMYFSQLFYIIGIELSGVVVATCIQPAIPVFTGGDGVIQICSIPLGTGSGPCRERTTQWRVSGWASTPSSLH